MYAEDAETEVSEVLEVGECPSVGREFRGIHALRRIVVGRLLQALLPPIIPSSLLGALHANLTPQPLFYCKASSLEYSSYSS